MNEPKIEILQDTLATEMLKELKATSKRWFIAFIVVLVLWFSTIVGFIVYEYFSLPSEETSYEQMSDNDSENTIIGGDYNGFQTESDSQEQR